MKDGDEKFMLTKNQFVGEKLLPKCSCDCSDVGVITLTYYFTDILFTNFGTAEKLNNSPFFAFRKGFKGDEDQKLLILVCIQCRFY